MENGGYVFAAYAVIWAVVFGYVLFLVKRQAKVSRQLKNIEEARARQNES